MSTKVHRDHVQSRYLARKAARICTRCTEPLQPTDGVECRECTLWIGAQRRRRYHENRQEELARRAAMRLAKKLAGICMRCPLPCLEDNVMCEHHRDQSRRHARSYFRRITWWSCLARSIKGAVRAQFVEQNRIRDAAAVRRAA